MSAQIVLWEYNITFWATPFCGNRMQVVFFSVGTSSQHNACMGISCAPQSRLRRICGLECSSQYVRGV